MPKARRFSRLLHVHAEVDEINQNLGMSLRLIIAAHDAERPDRLAVLKQHAGNQRMERSLSRGYDIGMPRIQFKQCAPILQDNACITRDESRTKALKKAIDERNSVVIFVHNS